MNDLVDTTEMYLRTIYDLEEDVKSFNAPLPRVRIIPIEAFDPVPYL